MSSFDFSRVRIFPYFRQFFPAVYKCMPSLGHVIEYYDVDGGGVRRRMVIKLNRVHKRLCASDFKVYVGRLLFELNSGLYAKLWGGGGAQGGAVGVARDGVTSGAGVGDAVVRGVGADVVRMGVAGCAAGGGEGRCLGDVIGLFIETKEVDLRPDTMRSYRSFCGIFLRWCDERGVVWLDDVDRGVVAEFMRVMSVDKGLSNCSYNNYLKLGRALWGWFIEMGYWVGDNLFLGVKKKRREVKGRSLIPRVERERLLEWCAGSAWPGFGIVCMLVYGSLIRPKEIRMLRVEDVNLLDRYIRIRGENAKNHNERFAVLSEQTVRALEGLHLERFPRRWFLFGSHFVPSERMAGNKCYADMFDRVRGVLGWPSCYKLYSFRDSGITEMLEAGIPSVDVMKLADHSSLDVTTVYAKHRDPGLIDRLWGRVPEF